MAANQPKSQSQVPTLPPTILIVPKVSIQQDKAQAGASPQQEGASQNPAATQGVQTASGLPSGQQVVLNLQQAQLSQNANLSLGSNITLTVQPAQQQQQQQTRPASVGATVSQLAGPQVKLEGRKQDSAKRPNKVGAFLKPPAKQPMQVPQRVYRRSVAAIHMKQMQQIEKRAQTGAVAQPVKLPGLLPPNSQPGHISAILVNTKQLQGSSANSITITSGNQVVATMGKSSTGSPTSSTKSQPVLVQTAMSPKIIVQAAPTGTAHQTGPGKPVMFTGGQRFTIVPNTQGNLLSPTSVGPTTAATAATCATGGGARTVSPTVAQLARQQRLQKALAAQQQQHLIAPNPISQRPIALKQTATSPVQISPSVSVAPTQMQAVATSASTSTVGQIQFTPRIPLAITTQAQQLQQQQIQALTPKSKITLGQVGAISTVHHRTATTTPSTNTDSAAGTIAPGSNIVAPHQAPLTIIPKQMLTGTGQFILASGIQVPSSLQGTFSLQTVSTPLSTVQAKLIQTPVQGGSSTQASVQTNIMLQALPKYSQAQLKAGSSPASQVPTTVDQGSTSTSTVQPHLIQTCGEKATIGLIQVNLSQPQQSLATVNTLSQPIVRATVQAPIPQSQAEGSVAYRPQLLQVTGLPNQQFLQVVPPQQQQQAILPMPSSPQVSQAAVSVPVPIAPKIASPKLSLPHPILTPITAEADKPASRDPMSSIDEALKYKMPYPQAAVPQRKRRHSEIEEGEEEKEETKKEDASKEATQDEDNIEFTWEDYLEITGSKPAPHTAFKHVEASIQSGVSVGMKVEVQNKPSAFVPYKSYWVASVVTACGSLLLLRYGGYSNDRSRDFWVDMATGELHPIGWCARNGRSLRPPDELLNKGSRNWEEFLVTYLTGAKSIPEYVLYIRKVSSPTPVDRIKKGMRVEVQDELNPRHAWIAVIKETYGGRLRLRYAGIEDNADDFWLFYLHWRVHPIGWAKEKLVFMKPPAVLRKRIPNNTEAAWNTTYQYALSAALKEAAFPKEFFKDQPKIRCHRFRKGMKLEAVNPKVPSQICPATVSEWLNDKSFLVSIDNLTDERNKTTFMCNADSGGIFPVSWCEKHGYALTPPKGYEEPHFQWNSYLKQCDTKPAPKELFRIYSRDHEFRPFMKLEAVNPFCPSEICVATITKVVNRHMWVHFDNSKLPNLVVDSESYDIFPVGWCDSNGYVLKAPKKLIARKAKKVAIVWPEKHSPQPSISPMSPGRDLYQKIREMSRDEDSAEGHDSDWTGKVFFNHKCFSGPYLSKGRIAELPKAVGPGIVVLVLREVLSLLINAAYKPPRVLKELEIESEETAGMNGHLQVMKAKYKGKSYRSLVEICKSSVEMTEYLRTTCIKLECCPNLVSLRCVKDDEECPDNCTNLTKTKYTYQYGKKRKFHHIGRPPGRKNPMKSLLPPVRKGNKRRKKRRPFVHRKRHSLSQEDGGQDGNGGEELEDEEETEDGGRQEMGRGGGGLAAIKKNTTSQTVAHALLQSAKRKKIHPVPPRLILPHRERGTKLKTFAAILTSNRSHKKVEKEKSSVENSTADHTKGKTKAFLTDNKADDRLQLASNPLKWTTSEVVKFINKTDCAPLARIFEEQEIDGQALLLLTLPTVQECMDLKLGPAIKLCHHIERVKIAFYDQFAK
ncbi:scm-like with four MBT domains protein 1 [Acanthaster planci]|uniref:Scm-like with four MBT domains protein 1 n=1 Tax=Acanthaster planci TaxID=133434 RepID=A0A8B7ZIT3_ACAPL|nr:scm-like with four MBT domains protein 1 [Acanthaster planci]